MKWLRLGIRRRIVKLFYPSESSKSWLFSVHYHGIEYYGDISNAQEWHVYFFGGYELKETSLLEGLLKVIRHPVAFDVGANLGGYALIMAKHAEMVHAFEPYLPLADRIDEQIERNGIENIRLHRFGLGNTNEIKSYYLDKTSNNSGTGSFIAEHSNAPQISELQVRLGDDWNNGGRVDLIKIDIEGYESMALKGLSSTLAANKPIILMEVTETSASLFELNGGLHAILKFDFEIYEVCNPLYYFGLFQSDQYSLKKCESLNPRKASFNVLIVPDKRTHILEKINCVMR